jgi:2,4-dienoyl-CoA reductase-like NADH-dependent reductase (Old Yellow Enzyme family)
MLSKIILGFLFGEVSRMDPAKSILFEPVKKMNMELRNRFVRSATYDGCVDKGYVTEKQLNLYETLAEGGVGLIITGITYVHHSGQISKF